MKWKFGLIASVCLLSASISFAGSQAYQQQTQATLSPGQSVSLAGYTITAHGTQTNLQPGVKVVQGVL